MVEHLKIETGPSQNGVKDTTESALALISIESSISVKYTTNV